MTMSELAGSLSSHLDGRWMSSMFLNVFLYILYWAVIVFVVCLVILNWMLAIMWNCCVLVSGFMYTRICVIVSLQKCRITVLHTVCYSWGERLNETYIYVVSLYSILSIWFSYVF